MNKTDRDTLNGIIITILLYLVLAIIIILSIYYQTFKIQILSLILLLISVLAAETMEQAILSVIKWKPFILLFLVIKETLTSFLITLASLMIVAKIIELFIGNAEITKNLFNLIVLLTFITALFLYWLYSSLNISAELDKLSNKLLKVNTFSSTAIKESINKNEIINLIDLIAVITTVFLLGNSTISTVVNINEKQIDLFDTIEYKMLYIVMAIYVQVAYYKLPIKHR